MVVIPLEIITQDYTMAGVQGQLVTSVSCGQLLVGSQEALALHRGRR